MEWWPILPISVVVALRYNRTMSQTSVLDPVPLVFPEDGSAIRVSGTRLTLDTVVGAFKRGATAEEIAQTIRRCPCPTCTPEARPEYQDLRARLLARLDKAKAESR